MKFIKPDDVFFNRKDLENAIKLKTDTPNELYKISIRNNYPCLCIRHEHHYVHRLLGELYFGNIKGFSIHHLDGDKKNASRENLILITNSEHSILHHVGKDYRSSVEVRKSINRMSEKRKRKDIDINAVRKAREDGLTYKELCKRFQCGNSVIRRCLIDWSEVE